jgi:hypothetical protein
MDWFKEIGTTCMNAKMFKNKHRFINKLCNFDEFLSYVRAYQDYLQYYYQVRVEYFQKYEVVFR